MEADLEDDFTDLMIVNSQGDSADLNTAESTDMGKRNEIVVN